MDGFINDWNQMGTVDEQEVEINNVAIYSHSNPTTLLFAHGTRTNAMSVSGLNSQNNPIGGLSQLNNKDISKLYLYACNSGNVTYFKRWGDNLGSAFSVKTGGGVVYAYDGNVGFGKAPFYSDGYYDRLSNTQTSFNEICNEYNDCRDPYGQVRYWNGRYIEEGIPADLFPGFDFPTNSIRQAGGIVCEISI